MLSWDFCPEPCQQSCNNPGIGGKPRLRKRHHLIHKSMARKLADPQLERVSVQFQIPSLNVLKEGTGKPRPWARWLWRPRQSSKQFIKQEKTQSWGYWGWGGGWRGRRKPSYPTALRQHPYQLNLALSFDLRNTAGGRQSILGESWE